MLINKYTLSDVIVCTKTHSLFSQPHPHKPPHPHDPHKPHPLISHLCVLQVLSQLIMNYHLYLMLRPTPRPHSTRLVGRQLISTVISVHTFLYKLRPCPLPPCRLHPSPLPPLITMATTSSPVFSTYLSSNEPTAQFLFHFCHPCTPCVCMYVCMYACVCVHPIVDVIGLHFFEVPYVCQLSPTLLASSLSLHRDVCLVCSTAFMGFL